MRSAFVSLHGPHYMRGLVAVMAGGFALSFTGAIFRMLDGADAWQILFYRTLSLTIGVLLVVAYRSRGRLTPAFRAIGRPGLVAGAIMGFGFPFFTLAIVYTTVADALFLISTSPLFAAIIGWMVLRERVRGATWIASIVALVGVAVMFGDGFTGGGFFGKAMALGAAASMASYTVCVRFRPHGDMSPALVIAGLIATAFAATMADNLGISLHDLLLCVFMGGVLATFGFIMFTYGPKYVPAAEVMLLTLVEVILGPIWAVLIVGEIPSYYTIAGGAIVLAAVVLFSLLSFRRVRGRRNVEKPKLRKSHPQPVVLPPLAAEVSPPAPLAPHAAAPLAPRSPAPLAPFSMEAALDIAYQKAVAVDHDPPPRAPLPPRIDMGLGEAAPLSRQPVADTRVRISEPREPAPVLMDTQVPTLESRLADRLRPLLQEWVDLNLPRITESVVHAEVRTMIERAEDADDDRP
jgi:drug/metabolite transporter (DMT)-like permease